MEWDVGAGGWAERGQEGLRGPPGLGREQGLNDSNDEGSCTAESPGPASPNDGEGCGRLCSVGSAEALSAHSDHLKV